MQLCIQRLCMCAKLLQSCLTLCNPMDCMQPIRLLCPWVSPGKNTGMKKKKRILEWVAVPFSRDLPNLGIEPPSLTSPALAGGFFTTSDLWEAHIQRQGFKNETVMLLSIDSNLAFSKTLTSKGQIGNSYCAVVRTLHFHCRDTGSILGQGTKNPQGLQPGQKRRDTGNKLKLG